MKLFSFETFAHMVCVCLLVSACIIKYVHVCFYLVAKIHTLMQYCALSGDTLQNIMTHTKLFATYIHNLDSNTTY